MSLQAIQTNTGKTIQDFDVPEIMLQRHPDIVEMILGSQSMDDQERQYWFSLYESMEGEHIERLRDILTKERERRSAIGAKYGPKKPELTPEQIAQRNAQFSANQESQWAEIRAKEADVREKDAEASEDILGELDNL